jgi:hypothetical protein
MDIHSDDEACSSFKPYWWLKLSALEFNWWGKYIKGDYHCDTCPFCWGGEYLDGCDDYDDCGCYIKGELPHSCRLIPPIRFLIGWGKRKKSQYYENHRYDGVEDWYKQRQHEEHMFQACVLDTLGSAGICRWNEADKSYESVDYETFQNYCSKIQNEYDEAMRPIQHIKLRTQWAILIKTTMKRFISIFKPYFCK